MRNGREQVSLHRGLAGVLVGLALGLTGVGCSYDPDERCDADQELYGDALRCVCKLPKVWSPTGCVECPAGEIASAAGCACAEGQARSPQGVCTDVPEPVPSVISSSDNPDAHVSCDAALECTDAGAKK